jgi:3-oxoacyl-[acyl-carrier-protein] synthase-3
VAADNLFRMNGPRIYKAAVRRVQEMVDGLLAELGLTPDDIDLLVPHQASGPGVEAMQKLRVRKERIVDIVGTYGNCIAASLPMALAIAVERGQLRRGHRVLLVGTGAGLGIGAAVLRW